MAGGAPLVRPDEVLPPPPLAPVATTRAWMPALQSLRGLAALWVVLYHLDVYLNALQQPLVPIPGVRHGWLGVDLFFVLSAYLLGQPFLDGRAPRWGRFLADRFLRIAPPYYAAYVLTAVGYALWAPYAWIPGLAAWSVLFVQNHGVLAWIAVNPAFWSLAVEMQFYLVLPLLARPFRGRRWPWALAAMTAATLAYRALLVHEGSPLALQLATFSLPAFLSHFALGLAVCRIRLLDRPVGSGIRRATFLAGIPLVAVPALVWVPAGSVYFSGLGLAGDTLVRPLAACGFALMVLATASGGWVAKALAWRPLDWLGRISYSLYLIHIPVQVLSMEVLDPRDGPMRWAAVATVASVLAGWLLYRAVEAPAEAWRRRRKLRQRAAVGKGVAAA